MTDRSNGAMQHDAQGRLRHLLTLEGLDRATLERLLARAARHVARPGTEQSRTSTLSGRTLATLFFEPSTRTRASFTVAAQRLGMDVFDLGSAGSSTVKGETLEDTLRTLQAMGIDAFAIRHSLPGVPARLAEVALPHVSILNAGESSIAHPTQGLLDVLTIRQHKGHDLERLKVAIVGDVRHSRVAASASTALRTLGVGELRFVAPAELLPDGDRRAHSVHDELEQGIAGCDVVMMLRVQRERMPEGLVPDDATYHRRWGLTAERLARTKPDCIVMHPGPVNRGVELASDVMDGPRAVIFEQVNNGVAVRMAVLETLLGAAD